MSDTAKISSKFTYEQVTNISVVKGMLGAEEWFVIGVKKVEVLEDTEINDLRW
jgi:hypothetical protein